MLYIIQLFALTVFVAGGIIVVKPDIIFSPLRNNYTRPALQVVAVVQRVVLGVLLIKTASDSNYPLVIEILGWMSVAAALIFAVMGRRYYLGLMAWAFSILKRYGRLGGLAAMVFGGFLLFAYF